LKKFKILCIDGGGIKGLFPATILASIEADLGIRVGDYFDLVAGTSTGGIIAAGVGLRIPAETLKDFYLTHGPSIFRKSKWIPGCILGLTGFFLKTYKGKELRKVLDQVFNETKLGDSKTRLLIPAMNALDGNVHVFKTRHHSTYVRDWKMSMVDVCMATAAAPTYFENHKTAEGLSLIDGGMWANNPILIAVIESLCVLKIPPEQIEILSLGCTTSPFDTGWLAKVLGGKVFWAKKIADIFMKGQSDSAQNMTDMLLGKSNSFRIQRIAPSGKYELDSTDSMQDLVGFGYSDARAHIGTLKERFFSERADVFTADPCST